MYGYAELDLSNTERMNFTVLDNGGVQILYIVNMRHVAMRVIMREDLLKLFSKPLEEPRCP